MKKFISDGFFDAIDVLVKEDVNNNCNINSSKEVETLKDKLITMKIQKLEY